RATTRKRASPNKPLALTTRPHTGPFFFIASLPSRGLHDRREPLPRHPRLRTAARRHLLGGHCLLLVPDLDGLVPSPVQPGDPRHPRRLRAADDLRAVPALRPA